MIDVLRELSPADLISLSDLPTTKTISASTTVLQLVNFNPQRYLLIVGTNASVNIALSPDPNMSSGIGPIILTPTLPYVVIVKGDFGILASSAWYCSGVGMGGSVTVCEATMPRWPRENYDAAEDMRKLEGLKCPTRRNGRQHSSRIWDYWQALTGQHK